MKYSKPKILGIQSENLSVLKAYSYARQDIPSMPCCMCRPGGHTYDWNVL